MLFRKLAAGLPDGCASVHVTVGTQAGIVQLLPRNSRAAPLRAIVSDNDKQVTLIAGRGSFFEIPNTGHRYTKLPLVEEVEAISLAVINGKLEESVVLDGEEVLFGKGTVVLLEPITVRWRKMFFNPFRRSRSEKFNYESYCSSDDVPR